VELAICYYKAKIDGWFRRTFKEQAGGAELIATLVLVGIVMVLAFAFRDKLMDLAKNIWNNLIRNGTTKTKNSDVVQEW
jgi:hypothetical protein